MPELNVIGFDPLKSRREEVVERARRMLEMAERGEITDLSYAAGKPDGGFVTGFTATPDAPRRLAAVAHLQHRLHVMMDSQAEEDAADH